METPMTLPPLLAPLLVFDGLEEPREAPETWLWVIAAVAAVAGMLLVFRIFYLLARGSRGQRRAGA
jgi:hypothetical protein